MDITIILFAITNFLLLAFCVYQNERHQKDRERKDEMIKDLELKLISKNIAEYDSVRGDEPENMDKKTEDPYRPLDEVPLDDLIDAEDRL